MRLLCDRDTSGYTSAAPAGSSTAVLLSQGRRGDQKKKRRAAAAAVGEPKRLVKEEGQKERRSTNNTHNKSGFVLARQGMSLPQCCFCLHTHTSQDKYRPPGVCDFAAATGHDSGTSTNPLHCIFLGIIRGESLFLTRHQCLPLDSRCNSSRQHPQKGTWNAPVMYFPAQSNADTHQDLQYCHVTRTLSGLLFFFILFFFSIFFSFCSFSGTPLYLPACVAACHHDHNRQGPPPLSCLPRLHLL